jgi:hypothetical protein
MRLDEYRSNITSQFGENGILAYLISAFPNIPKTCLEVGASDGVENSNTYPLWKNGGWKALLIEAGRDQFLALNRNTDHCDAVLIRETIEPTGSRSLDALAKQSRFPAVGVCSIDIDSCDYWIFAHMQARPAIVIIECNPDFPILVAYHDPEGPSLLRHSARAVAELGAKKGYRAIACTGPNVILMREDIIATNPDAVPNVPLFALEDTAYTASRSRWIVGAKPFTYQPVYKRRPNLAVRTYFGLRAAGLSARAWLKGRGGSLGAISETHRKHIEAHGLRL